MEPGDVKEAEEFISEIIKMKPPMKDEIVGENISDDGKKATVSVKYTYKDGKEDITDMPFVKRDSGWK